MPGSAHVGSISAGFSLATVLVCLWVAERIWSPIGELERCRGKIRGSLVAASTLDNNIARLAGRGDVDTLSALRNTRMELANEADQLSCFRIRRSIPLRLYIGIRRYDLARAAQALMRLGVSMFASPGERSKDTAVVRWSLRLSARA